MRGKICRIIEMRYSLVCEGGLDSNEVRNLSGTRDEAQISMLGWSGE